jgi:glucose-1-phosphate adenylyltransferase
MRKTIGIVFAGGRVEDLSALTERRPKAAVLFGGIYRAIDFALTNLADTGIAHVGILAQYRPSSLMDHVASGMAWDLAGTSRSVRFLPPYLGLGSSEWYRGPADALYQNLDFIERLAPDDVIAVSGDHVYSMDYQSLLSFHAEHGADLTMAFVERKADAHRFGIGELNTAGQILNFTEKPTHPRGCLASMSVYVFRRHILVEELRRAERGEDGSVTFQLHEILRRMMSRRRAYGWVYHGEWAYTRTLDEYHAFHRDLLGATPRIDLGRWAVRSNVLARRIAPPPPARCFPGSRVEDSLLAPGCVVRGTVRGSVLSPNVVVGEGAEVSDSILWDKVVVDPGAVLRGVISDKRAHFGKGCQVGVGEVRPSEEFPASLTDGSTVVGMDARIPPGARVGRNCILHPECGEKDLDSPIASGTSVRRARHAEGTR